jgi:hypothetical protein
MAYMQEILRSPLALVNAPATIAHCNTVMDLFNEEFAKLVESRAKKNHYSLAINSMAR